jgi:two-component system invasion response regulator UvrY
MKKILVADPYSIVRLGVRQLLKERFKEIELLEAHNLEKLHDVLEKNNIDLLILEINLLSGNQVKAVTALKAKYKNLKVLIFTGMDESLYAFPFMKAGADGYLSKETEDDETGRAIDSILFKDKKYLSEALKDESIQMMIGSFKSRGLSTQDLSAREKDVFRLLLNGKGIKEIGSLLNLHVSTVSTYRSRIFEKYGVTNIVDLVRSVRESEEESD